MAMNNYQSDKMITSRNASRDAQKIVSQKIRPVFDAESIRQSGFVSFASDWQSVVPQTRAYIPKSEYDKLAKSERTHVDYLLATKYMSILNCGAELDYDQLFGRLAAMKLPRIAMVCGDNANVSAYVAAANRHDLRNMLYYKLTDNGALVPCDSADLHVSSDKLSTSKTYREYGGTSQYNGFSISTRPESITVSTLYRKQPLGIGKVVYDSQGTIILLKSEAMVNADSITYTTNHHGLWAKIYAQQSLNTLNEEKCKRMLSKDISFAGLCWPKDILRDADGMFAGILVPEARGVPLFQCVFKGVENGIRKYFPRWDKRQLVQLTTTILKKIMYMHSKGALFGCLNPASILVYDENNVYFVDTDHFQIEGFPCVNRNVMFTPPELQEKLRLNKMYLCTFNHEKYAVALLVFMLLMPGKMPYAIENSDHAPDSIVRQQFVFSYKGEHGSDRSVGSWRYVWSHLTPFKEAFYRTFQNGEKFNSPERRLGSNRWLKLSSEFNDELNGNDLYDPNTRELVPKSFKRSRNSEFIQCRYCKIEHPRYYYRNEYFDEHRICKSCLEEPSNASFMCVDCGRTFIYTNRTAIFHSRMKEKGWSDQKHCRDCKSKVVICMCCRREVSLIKTNNSNGYCFDCERNRKSAIYDTKRCRDCGRYFDITVGDYEHILSKRHSIPTRCKPCRESRPRY